MVASTSLISRLSVNSSRRRLACKPCCHGDLTLQRRATQVNADNPANAAFVMLVAPGDACRTRPGAITIAAGACGGTRGRGGDRANDRHAPARARRLRNCRPALNVQVKSGKSPTRCRSKPDGLPAQVLPGDTRDRFGGCPQLTSRLTVRALIDDAAFEQGNVEPGARCGRWRAGHQHHAKHGQRPDEHCAAKDHARGQEHAVFQGIASWDVVKCQHWGIPADRHALRSTGAGHAITGSVHSCCPGRMRLRDRLRGVRIEAHNRPARAASSRWADSAPTNARLQNGDGEIGFSDGLMGHHEFP